MVAICCGVKGRGLEVWGLMLFFIYFLFHSIVVSGVEPFAEDTWGQFEIGQILMKVAKPCSRCKIPNTDQVR